MTREEAIEILIAVAVCESPILSCDFCARCLGMGTDCTHPTDQEIEEAVLLLKGASEGMAISALRQQETVTDSHQLNEPLTLDELVEFGVRSENGENIFVYCTPLNDWAKVFKFGLLFFGTEDYRSWPEIEASYSKTWLAYRQKPAENFGQECCPDQMEAEDA